MSADTAYILIGVIMTIAAVLGYIAYRKGWISK